MKNVSLLLNGVLAVAVIVLYILHFVPNNGAAVKTDIDVAENGPKREGGLRIAYIKLDSLLSQYDMAQDLFDALSKSNDEYTKEIKSSAERFEKAKQEFQEKLNRGGFISEQRAQQEYEKLMGEGQKVANRQNDLTVKLNEQQKANDKQFADSLLNYLTELNRDRQYDYILSGASVLLGDEATNITEQVVKALNERYSHSKKK
ncbi:MAG: OmpH family outer membrane protein [Bacteroidales bacterium]|jgi:outer membrane protein|nr:OmpH family outer membrane protein [Bacteroidales bacterium]